MFMPVAVLDGRVCGMVGTIGCDGIAFWGERGWRGLGRGEVVGFLQKGMVVLVVMAMY